MGYRSDVKIIVVFETELQLEETMATYMALGNKVAYYHKQYELLKYCDRAYTRTEQGDGHYQWVRRHEEYPCVEFSAEDIKWYPDFEDVQAVEYLIQLCQEVADERESFKYAYRFIRIGEEFDDIDITSDANDSDLGYFADCALEVERRVTFC